MKQELHIVSFDIPFPANYGGVIDVFYKIKALAALDFSIILHCFKYGNRKEQETLKSYCSVVYYYKRNTGMAGLSMTLPYIVSSRANKVLLNRLIATKAPILFEGLHTCHYLSHKHLTSHTKLVRTHNVEHEYYASLKQSESTIKKFYYLAESKRLQRFETILNHADVILPISQTDATHFKTRFQGKIVTQLSPFHASEKVTIIAGKGNYNLYHGSLGNTENEKSALFLINEVAAHSQDHFIIAGSNPTAVLVHTCEKYSNVSLVSNPSTQALEKLISEAHIHLLYASQKSGFKLKFLNALFNGRHIIANSLMATEDDLKPVVHKAEEAHEWLAQLTRLKTVTFTESMVTERRQQLAPYSNTGLAHLLSDLIAQHH